MTATLIPVEPLTTKLFGTEPLTPAEREALGALLIAVDVCAKSGRAFPDSGDGSKAARWNTVLTKFDGLFEHGHGPVPR